MKLQTKARVALTAVAAFAVIGGAIAVNANAKRGFFLYTASALNVSATALVSDYTTTTTTTTLGISTFGTLIYNAPAKAIRITPEQ